MTKIFVDSDILIDLLAKREFYQEAAILMTLVKRNKMHAYTTPIVIANVHYILAKYTSKTKAREALKLLRQAIGILPMTQTIVDHALESDFPDFEDALQYYAAEQRDLDFIVTRNKKDYRKGRIKAVTAGELLRISATDS